MLSLLYSLGSVPPSVDWPSLPRPSPRRSADRCSSPAHHQRLACLCVLCQELPARTHRHDEYAVTLVLLGIVDQVFYLRLLHSFGRQLGTDCLAPFVIRVGHVLRNTRPRITSLYWLADSDPRSLSAAFQSVSLSPSRHCARGACFFRAALRFLPIDAPRRCRAWWASPRQHEGRIGRITLSLGPPPIPRVAV